MSLKDILDKIDAEHKAQENFTIDSRVLIIDGLNTYIRSFAAVPTMNDDGEHVGGISGFLKSIGAAIRQHKPTRCIVVFDGKGGAQRRRKIYPEYKENRRSMTRLNRTYNFKDLAEESDALKKQLIMLAHILKELPVTVLAPPNVEADDVIAYIAHTIEERDGQSIILSTDKDFLQIVNESITVWNPIKKKMYTPDEILDDYGIHPNNFVIFRTLDGDKSDNIAGVKGVGAKSLLKRYPQLSEEKKVTIDEIVVYAKNQEKGKIFENIVNNENILYRNFRLMQLKDTILSGTTQMEIVDKLDEHNETFNKKGLTKLLVDHKMIGLFSNYDEWLNQTFRPLTRFLREK